jgi:hypothetical protein
MLLPHTDGFIHYKKCFLSIIFNDAKTNDSAMRVLRDVLNMTKYVLVGGKLFHMRWYCYVHITNLLVQF